MSQINNKFTAKWIDTTTAPWVPLTGLSAVITIREASAPYTIVVNEEPMVEVGGGWYIYEYSWYNSTKDYLYDCNPVATAYIESWVTSQSIWNDDIVWNSSIIWSFWDKFSQYGGVSHVIDRSTFDEESKKRLDALVDAMKDKKEVVVKPFNEGKIDAIISSINDIKNLPATAHKQNTDIAVLKWLIDSIPKPEVVDNSLTEEMLVEWIPEMMDNIELIAKTLKEKDEISSAMESVLFDEIDRKNKEIDRLLIENKKLKNLI